MEMGDGGQTKHYPLTLKIGDYFVWPASLKIESRKAGVAVVVVDDAAKIPTAD